MKSANRFRIIEQYESLPGTYYIVQELFQNSRGTRSEWRTRKHYCHEAVFDTKYFTLEDAQDVIKRQIHERNFIPRIVVQIDTVETDPDYAAALQEMATEGIGI